MEGERGATETVGTVLLVVVVVIIVSVFSAVLVGLQVTGPAAPTVTVDAAIDTETVRVSNMAGSSLDASELRVVVREESGAQVAFTPDAANVTGTDDVLAPGETFERAHGLALGTGDRATVIVIHRPSNTRLLSASLVVGRPGASRVVPVGGSADGPPLTDSSTPVELPIDKPI